MLWWGANRQHLCPGVLDVGDMTVEAILHVWLIHLK
jgi:hypothetical protein